jgi:hypothetical protein
VSGIQDLGWRNINALRRYPFSDGSSMFFEAGAIPSAWILDARIYARGNYGSSGVCRIGRLIKDVSSISLVFYSGDAALGTAVISFDPFFSDALVTIMDGDIPAGCLVIDSSRTALLQAIPAGDYALAEGVADLVPSCIEPLPARQVVSISKAAGDVRISAAEGISLVRQDASTVRVDIIGDPHSARYGCTTAPGNTPLDLLGTFLERLTVLHYVKTPNGDFVGPYASNLESRSDGSIALILKTPQAEGPVTREVRPAFRITVDGSSITFSMAGGS